MNNVSFSSALERKDVPVKDKINNDSVIVNQDGDVGGGILHPGERIRPMISTKVAVQLVERLYGVQVLSCQELNSYNDRNFFVKVNPENHRKNPFVSDLWPHGYLLKVLNSMDSRKHHIDGEHKVQRILALNGFNCPQPVLNIKGQDSSLEDISYDLPTDNGPTDTTTESENDTQNNRHARHLVRLLTFVPGRLLVEVEYTPRLLRCVGHYLASLEKTLQGFSHSTLERHRSVWSLDCVPELFNFTPAIKDLDNRRLVEEVLKSFMEEVVPKKEKFQRGVIHGDFNGQNILVRKVNISKEFSSSSLSEHNGSINSDQNEYEVSGILDFGDTCDSFYLYDIAILIMYAILDSKVVDMLDVGGHVLAGYTSVEGRTLNKAEFDALRICVAARYAQSLTMGAYTHSLNPTNEYILTTAKNGWNRLRRLWETPASQFNERWRCIIAKHHQKQLRK